ncbi:DUF4177 domain-containing protein [Candidatus Poribacteria bacterium]|nr:DUF4177 domain-containing protein [Candidatus Poribacteria bacterium]
MPKWEYKALVQHRPVMSGLMGPQWDTDIKEYLTSLGNEGWELVAIVPRSDSPAEAPGYTTSELWVFKRPKPGL